MIDSRLPPNEGIVCAIRPHGNDINEFQITITYRLNIDRMKILPNTSSFCGGANMDTCVVPLMEYNQGNLLYVSKWGLLYIFKIILIDIHINEYNSSEN